MSIPIEDIVGRLDQVREFDTYYSALCPFHSDSHPSLLVFRDGWFRCLSSSCGKVGRLETLWDKVNGRVISKIKERTLWTPPSQFSSTLDFVQRTHNILVKNPDTLGWYLKLRGVDDRIESAYLGWYNGWYVMPVFTEARELQGMVWRAGAHIQHATGRRYWIPSGQDSLMYVPDWKRIKESSSLFVVFGMLDALVLSSLCLPVVTPTNGCRSFDPHWLDWYRHQIIVVPDIEERNSGVQLAGQLGWRGKLLMLDYPDGMKDPADFAQQNKRQELLAQLARYQR